MTTIYSVNWTEYDDDYKDRESYCQDPILFSTREKAEKYLLKILPKEIEEQINIFDKIPKNYKKYLDIKEEYKTIKTKYHDLETLTKLYEYFCEGEFIPYKFTWKISEAIVDSKE